MGAIFDERPELLASSSVFLLPARAVGFSIMVLEAFAAGVPVVALPGLGTDRAGDHWSNVVRARNQTAAAFAEAIVETLRVDQSARVARGRAIARTYDWDRIGRRILDGFRQVVVAGRLGGPQVDDSGAEDLADRDARSSFMRGA